MAHVADQDEPVGSNPRRWNFPRSGSGSKTDTPFNIQEFWKLSAGLHTHDGKEGTTDEEMSEGNQEESYAAIRSVVTVPTAVAQEARENPKVDELRERLVKDYPQTQHRKDAPSGLFMQDSGAQGKRVRIIRVGINKRCLLIRFGKLTNERTNE